MEIYEGGVIYSTNISLPLNRDSIFFSPLFNPLTSPHICPDIPSLVSFYRYLFRENIFTNYLLQLPRIFLVDPFIEERTRLEDSWKGWRFPRFYLGWISDVSRFQVFLLTILSNRVKLVKIFIHRSLIRTSRSRFRSFLKDTLIHEFMMILEARESISKRKIFQRRKGKESGDGDSSV